MNKYQGTWLTIKTGDDYGPPEFLEFDNGKVLHMELLENAGNRILVKNKESTEILSETQHEFINEKRLRFHRMGKTVAVFDETESVITDTMFETDYELIEPTQTDLTEKEIEKLEFNAVWNDKNIPIVFNKNLDSPIIQTINKRLNQEGQMLVLEKLKTTYFASLYHNGIRSNLMPIKEINRNSIKLYGFPKEPFEVIGKRK